MDNFTFNKNLSWKDKKNVKLLQRLIYWKQGDLLVAEILRVLEARKVALDNKSTCKPELAEMLRIAIEREMWHLPVHMYTIRMVMLEQLTSGARCKDGYNKKSLAAKLRSRGLAVKSKESKGVLMNRLRAVYQAERDEFFAKSKELVRPSAKAPVPKPKTRCLGNDKPPPTAVPSVESDTKPAATPIILTAEQKARIEANRLRALERRQQHLAKQQQQQQQQPKATNSNTN